MLISAAALVGTLCLWTFASGVGRSQQIAFGPGLYASAQRTGFDGQLLLFNDRKNGPQYGINAYHSFDVSRPLPGIAVWSSSGGLMAHPGWWTAYVNLLYPIGLFAIVPTVWLFRKRKPPGRGFPVHGETATG